MASRSAASAGETLMCLLIRRSPFVYSSERGRNATLPPTRNLDLLFKNWRRSADLLPFQSDIYFDTVGDFDERYATRHAVLFAIESHGAVETAGGRSFAVAREGEFLHLGDTANGEVALDVKGVWSGLNDFRRLESDQRRFLYVKEILTLQLAVLHVVSG